MMSFQNVEQSYCLIWKMDVFGDTLVAMALKCDPDALVVRALHPVQATPTRWGRKISHSQSL